MREDPTALATIASQAKTALYRTRCYLEQMAPGLRPYFLGARKGDLLGPCRLAGEFAVFWVLDKILPSSDDAAIRRRAEQCIVRRLIDYEVNTRVQWCSRWCGGDYAPSAPHVMASRDATRQSQA